MIRIEDLVAGPPPYVFEKILPPLVTDDQIREITRKKIERARRRTMVHIRWGEGSVHDILFSDYSGQEYSNLTPIDDSVSIRPALGRAEPARFQAVVFELMKEYGLDESIFMPDPSMTFRDACGRECKDGIRSQSQGTAVEWLAFPSQKFPGLQFTRSRTHWEVTGENIGLAWHVSDGLAPAMKVGPWEWYLPEVKKALAVMNPVAR